LEAPISADGSTPISADEGLECGAVHFHDEQLLTGGHRRASIGGDRRFQRRIQQ
jgi:hypothetical protein